MTPTTRFRYIERSVPMLPFYKTVDAYGNTVQATQTFRILQQWWKVENVTDAVHNNVLDGEWRDIPLEVEA
jgi:hypothetical protein